MTPTQWRSQRGGGRGATAPSGRNSAPLAPQMKLHFVQRSMESRHFESRSAPPPLRSPLSPLAAPSFWKVWLRPCTNKSCWISRQRRGFFKSKNLLRLNGIFLEIELEKVWKHYRTCIFCFVFNNDMIILKQIVWET